MKTQANGIRFVSVCSLLTSILTGCGGASDNTQQNQKISSEVEYGNCKVEVALETLASPSIQSTQIYSFRYREQRTYSADDSVTSYTGTESGIDVDGTEWGPDRYSGTETFLGRTQINDTDYDLEFKNHQEYLEASTNETRQTDAKIINTFRKNPDGSTTLLKKTVDGEITGETYTQKTTDIAPDTAYVVTTYANLDRYQSNTHRTKSRVKTCRIQTTAK